MTLLLGITIYAEKKPSNQDLMKLAKGGGCTLQSRSRASSIPARRQNGTLMVACLLKVTAPVLACAHARAHEQAVFLGRLD